MIKKILAGLEQAKQQNPALAEMIDLHYDLIQAQAQVPSAQTQCDEQQALASLQQGRPLLHSQELTLDWQAFDALFAKVCRIAAQHRDDLAEQFQELLALQENDPGQVRALAVAYLGEDRDRDRDREGELLSFVLNHALRPFLLAFAQVHAPLVRQEYWKRGQCPVCGGEPDMAFLKEEPANRYLVCSRCDAQWLFGRIKCAFCANDDPHKLSFYPSEDEEYRVYTCQKCQRYLKAIDLRKARRRVHFPVERVTTLALDIAAREQGFV